MSDTRIAEALLQHSSIVALVGAAALAELPQGRSPPALVYQAFTTPTAYLDGESISLLRLQLNPLHKDPAGVEVIHAAIEAALAWRAGEEVAGHHIKLIEPGPYSGWSKDELTGTWTRSRDFLVRFESL